MRMIKLALFFLTAISVLAAEPFPLNELKLLADGLNIEGGTIYHQYLRQEQIWSNLCIVLDRPFEDGVEWQELTNANRFPLKEAALLDYNEAQVNFAYATIMHYYLTHAHEIAAKSQHQLTKILIQVHRNTSGPCHVELLERLLKQCYPELEGIKQEEEARSKYELFSYYFPKLNVEINFCYGTAPENLGALGKYSDIDIALSFSLVAGLHSDWKSSSLLIPYEHIPFSLNTLILARDRKYFVQNHLEQILDDLINKQDAAVLKTISEQFYSLNPRKKPLKARKLTHEDFKKATLLQVDGLFNPSQLPPIFKLESARKIPLI